MSVCFSRIVHFNFLGFKNKNGLRSHSETDSGFRSSYEPGVSEEEEMCTHVPVHLQRISAEIPAHGAVALRRSVFSPHHRSVSSQTHPVYVKHMCLHTLRRVETTKSTDSSDVTSISKIKRHGYEHTCLMCLYSHVYMLSFTA